MNEENKRKMPNWGGTIPSWFTVIILAVIAFMGKSTMEEFKDVKSLGASTDKRVTVLEIQARTLQDAITELRLGNKDIVSELRAINVQLQKK